MILARPFKAGFICRTDFGRVATVEFIGRYATTIHVAFDNRGLKATAKINLTLRVAIS